MGLWDKFYGVTVSTEDFKSFSQGSIPCGTTPFLRKSNHSRLYISHWFKTLIAIDFSFCNSSSVSFNFFFSTSPNYKPFTIWYFPPGWILQGKEKIRSSATEYGLPSLITPMLEILPSGVPSHRSLTWSQIALAALAADDLPHWSMISLPLFYTLERKSESSHLRSFWKANLRHWPLTVAW